VPESKDVLIKGDYEPRSQVVFYPVKVRDAYMHASLAGLLANLAKVIEESVIIRRPVNNELLHDDSLLEWVGYLENLDVDAP